MLPASSTCDICGGPATIVASERIYRAAELLDPGAIGEASYDEFSCKIDCPGCGMRTQVVRIST